MAESSLWQVGNTGESYYVLADTLKKAVEKWRKKTGDADGPRFILHIAGPDQVIH